MIDELRELIVASAPDPDQAAPVRTCRADEPIDRVIPFSSVIVLGTIVAVEDRYGVIVTKTHLANALQGGVTLERLASMIEALK